MNPQIQQVAREVSDRVARGRSIAPHPIERIAARELTIEIDSEPYPEVQPAFAEFCRLTDTEATLVGYTVRPVIGDDDIRARVSVTIDLEGDPVVGHGVADDVVGGAVLAFADATAHLR